ncbi:MAG: hypothetical protein AB203_01790 [Parcubacteria bacterium C7867-008]|nr:MAG: hypothetical protein AB203_01790 [Parcubacteria bacterium C7867-008]
MTPLILGPQIILIVLLLALLVVVLYFSLSSRRHIEHAIAEATHAIREELRFSIQPKTIQLSQGVGELVELAVEVWRMGNRIAKAGPDLPEVQKKGLETSIQKLTAYLDRYEIEVVDYTGKKYNDGLNLDVLSVEKDPSIEVPFVKETVEPTIICKGQVVRKAKIILVTN